jgi:hypothetical protein
MPTLTKVNPVFARHETFHPRSGWLKKGFDAALQDPGIFLREDASVLLGVGKNMVRSMRYWCIAFKVLTERSGREQNDQVDNLEDKGSGNLRHLVPTTLGIKLLSDEGWDPFLEDPASLWLLHWNLLKAPCYATVWQFTFNQFQQANFSTEDLFLSLADYCRGFTTSIADSSLKKDITCLFRMYAKRNSSSRPNEDTIDCPFSELGLLTEAIDSKRYLFRIGAKGNLPPDVITAACLDYASSVGQEQRTIALSRLAYNMDSPGMVFKLTESAISGAISKLAQTWSEFELRETAGLVQLSFTQEPSTLAEAILEQYYTGKGGR